MSNNYATTKTITVIYVGEDYAGRITKDNYDNEIYWELFLTVDGQLIAPVGVRSNSTFETVEQAIESFKGYMETRMTPIPPKDATDEKKDNRRGRKF